MVTCCQGIVAKVYYKGPIARYIGEYTLKEIHSSGGLILEKDSGELYCLENRYNGEWEFEDCPVVEKRWVSKVRYI